MSLVGLIAASKLFEVEHSISRLLNGILFDENHLGRLAGRDRVLLR